MNVLFSHQIKKGFGIQWVKCILAWWRIFESTTHFGCLGKHMTCRMERSQWYQASTKHGMHWSNTVAWQVTGLVCPDGWCKQGNITKHAPSYQRSSTFWQILQGSSDIVVTSLAALIHDLCRINWKYVLQNMLDDCSAQGQCGLPKQQLQVWTSSPRRAKDCHRSNCIQGSTCQKRDPCKKAGMCKHIICVAKKQAI